MHRKSGQRAWTAILLLALVVLPAVTGAQTGSRKPSPISVRGEFAFQMIYDDNVVRYSDEYIDDFRHGLYPYKFAIETYDDLICRPRVELTFTNRFLPGDPISVRVRYTQWIYTRNGIKDNRDWSVRVRRTLFGSDYLELNSFYAPMSYIRELSDRPPFAPGSSPLDWGAFGYVSNSFSLTYNRTLSPRWEVEGEVGRAIRYYNQPFMENDNWEWNLTGRLSYRVIPKVKLTGEYTYYDADARAADTVGETDEDSDDSDASYERDSYGVIVDYFPRRSLGPLRWIQLKADYSEYYFTTDKPLYEDPYHTGRKDAVYRIELIAETFRVHGPLSLEGGYRFTERTTDSPWHGDIAEDKDYTNHRVWSGVVYGF